MCVCSVCMTLCDPMDYSPARPSVHRIIQARILEWDTIYSRGSSQPRNRTLTSCVSWIGKWILYHCTTWEAKRSGTCTDKELGINHLFSQHYWAFYVPGLMVVVQSLNHVQLFCNPRDYSPPGSSVHRIFQARILHGCCHFLFQGIFPTQGSNPHLMHWRQILYHWATCEGRSWEFNSN